MVSVAVMIPGAYPGGGLWRPRPPGSLKGRQKKEGTGKERKKEGKKEKKKEKINNMTNRATFKHKQGRPGAPSGKKISGAPN